MSTSPYNRLIHEKSPYLKQHQDNPVHWYAWGDEAFAASRSQGKPIFLSIGYSTCHWCHVMAHESFEDSSVADFLNQHFISIKVDREERPDVDEIYMSAIHALGLRGGWPLSVFLTPDLKPFYGGTYWPQANFLNILFQLSEAWKKNPSQLQDSGDELLQFLRDQKSSKSNDNSMNSNIFERFYLNSQQSFDPQWGGFGRAPKFPHSVQLSMLLRYQLQHPQSEALKMVQISLDKMARGGIYDHLGGGFARYSVDERWEIPHFEKMLYDNALLTVTYLEAFQETKQDFLCEVAREVLEFVQNELQSPEGGFYSALDADSEGHEGKFYVWSWEELQQLLTPEEFQYWTQLYSAKPEGNFEGKINFVLADAFTWGEKNKQKHQIIRSKLLKYREKRIRPHRDEKILTSWNGLMIRAFALGYQVLGKPELLQSAKNAADFIKQNLWTQGQLLARYCDGEARFSARLEDYAFLIQALIDLYHADFDPEILKWAFELQKIQDRDFWDAEQKAYFFTDGKDPSLLLRTKEGMDGALPSPNGVSAHNLLRLYAFSGENVYREKAEAIFACFGAMLSDYPHAFSQLLLAYDFYCQGAQELAISLAPDEASSPILPQIRAEFFPYLVLAQHQGATDFPPLIQGRQAQKNTRFDFCQNQTCEAPSENALSVLEKLTHLKYKLKHDAN